MRPRIALLLWACAWLLCSPADQTVDQGGSTEITNATLMGDLYLASAGDSALPAAYATVRIYGVGRLPYLDSAADDSALADSLGRFMLTTPDTGYFNLVVTDDEGNAGMLDSLHLTIADTVRVRDTIEAPGAVTGSVRADSLTQLNTVAVYIRGTPYTVLADTGGSFALPAVPAAPLRLEFAIVTYDSAGQPHWVMVDTAIAVQPLSGSVVDLGVIALGDTAQPVVGHPPAFTSTAADMVDSAIVGREYRDTVHAADADGDSLAYRMAAGPLSMVLSDSIIAWTPGITDVGIHTMQLIADDGRGGLDTLTWSVKVSEDIIHQGMKYLTGGTFSMGSLADPGEQPVRRVTVSSFWIDSTEVTRERFLAVLGREPSTPNTYPGVGDPGQPVNSASWNDAAEYCNALSSRNGLQMVYSWSGASGWAVDYSKIGYRLPSEAEWEYACRAGSQHDYFWNTIMDQSADSIDSYAWHTVNSGGNPQPVARKRPNVFGLYDMSGNLEEWCNDWYDINYSAQTGSLVNPHGPGSGTERIVRGGCSWDRADRLRSAARRNGLPDNSEALVPPRGFRVVLPAGP